MKTCVSFDKDGTLDRRKYAGSRRISNVIENSYMNVKRLVRPPLVRLMVKHNIKKTPAYEIKGVIGKYGTTLYPGAKECLQALYNDGYNLSIVTSASMATTESGLKKNKIDHMIDKIITSADVRELKPHPECLEKLLKRLGVKKESVVYVGDARVDAEAAKRIGVDFVGVSWGNAGAEELRAVNNDPVIDNFKQLYKLIKTM